MISIASDVSAEGWRSCIVGACKSWNRNKVDVSMAPVAKDAVTKAYQRLWADNTLHGDVAARNLIISHDGRDGCHAIFFDRVGLKPLRVLCPKNIAT